MLFGLSSILCLLLILAIYLCGYQIYINFLQPGAIYYPTTTRDVRQMMKIAQLTTADVLIDLGSGDGRILMAAALLGARAVGYEINPVLVWQSRRRIRQAKLDKLATVKWKSFWKADFDQATIVTVYLWPRLMNRLQRLLDKKVNHPIRLIANDYPFPGLVAAKQSRRIYMYNFPQKTAPDICRER